jgi:hypothetical protein
MPESGASTIVILLSACVGMLFLLVLIALRIGGRLLRIERLLGQQMHKDDDAALRQVLTAVPAPETGGAFEEFLSEDPARRKMVKSEQFAAYRQWRQSRGMNWRNP